jgi:ABC-type Fe3+ transport system permease subunit
MIKYINKQGMKFSAIVVAGLMAGSIDAHANNFSKITENIGTSSEGLPGMVTGTSYILGTVIGALGILKIKDHVENPSSTPLKEGAIRLVAGGALLTLPTIFEVIKTTIDAGAVGTVVVEKAAKADFATQ